MKYPAVLSLHDILPELERFDALIDARSPAEFADDHLPGAINCPVLDNDERARVGTLYKEQGAFEAKKVGAAIVARNVAHHLDSSFSARGRDWKPLVYCWRGGNRSGAMAHILAKIGWPVVQLEGGYKEYRRHVIAALDELPRRFRYRVVCGTTGSGKSLLLRSLEAAGAQVLDLERIAAHRGSLLGNLPGRPQPTQKAFESGLWQALRRFDPAYPVYVESESKKVGNLRVPEVLMELIRNADCIAVTLPLEERVALLLREYPHFIAEPEPLMRQLDHLLLVHGREKIAHWQELAGTGRMAELVRVLLSEHYDPAYLRSIDRNFARHGQARPLALTAIDQAAFDQAARAMLADDQVK